MKNKRIIFFLVLVTFLGAIFRFVSLTKNPPSLTGDEISFGYASYSILKTGHDESGKFLPLVIQSIGDYKNPVPAYLMVGSFLLWGVNDFGIRFPNAVFGVLLVPMIFFFVKIILKDNKKALLGSLLASISPWLISYSRFAYEPLIASFFVLVGIIFLIKFLRDRQTKWMILSSFFLVLTMYTGFAPRLFIPIFLVGVYLLNIRLVLRDKKMFFLYFVLVMLFSLPMVYVSLFQGASTRFSMVFIGNDIEFSRYFNLGYFQGLKDVPYLFFFWVRRYLNYIEPSFLLTGALQMVNPGKIGLGLIYFFELPFFLIGVYYFLRDRICDKKILFLWLFIGIIPDSITNNQQHAGRLLHIAPLIILFNVMGFFTLFKMIQKYLPKFWRYLVYFTCTLIVIINLLQAFLVFTSHYPREKGESFDEGIREAVEYIILNQEKYDTIVFDTRRGIEGPYLISNPQMYLLFYSKYDPLKYQKIAKTYSNPDFDPYFKFDKYEFRYIDWPKDANKTKALFIGSPWSFPNTLDEKFILSKIIMKNGHPAYYIVSTKKL